MKQPIENIFCCIRFSECVADGDIKHADENDETEWYIPEWYHIYFCPFCGTNVQGVGFGQPERRNQQQKNSLGEKTI
ncbi:MAG: hypothetical protein KKD73_12345 [Proteobacteria bacterium]|nr:hypothetical protein [Pseudomonadota bacterium]MBU1640974.1 hypothetical protein [Pseudomonadota bacterium]